ncbi:MAG: Clp1/GlmU family protein [Endomicrobia bacterium]|nr:Clp1/GlmU family protein [Endomicrobiia bacterium]
MLVKKGIYLISGPVKVKLVKGDIECIGKKILPEEEIYIPEGKRIPVEINKDSELLVDKEESFVELPSPTIPEDWDKVVEYIMEEKINALIIFGEVDTGKTFFSTYLTNKLISKKLTPSVLDCDTGQSDIGPPSTLGLAIFQQPILFMTEVKPVKLYFVGSHSPAEHFLYYISGFTKLLNYGITNSDIVIIDTPGWVAGDGGRMIRKSELEILSALRTNYAVVLLQRGKEIEHLVKTVPAKQIIRLTVSKKASPTSTEERKKLREFVYKKYFNKIKKITLRFNEIVTDRVYFLTGETVDKNTIKIKNNIILWIEKLSGYEGLYIVSDKLMSEKDINMIKKHYSVKKIKNVTKDTFQDVVIALLDAQQDVICLGIIDEVNFINQQISMFIPEEINPTNVRILQFGSLKLTPEAKEKGFIEPGII